MGRLQKSEFELIDYFRKPFKSFASNVEIGNGDDCAVIAISSDTKLLITTDLLVENIHFLRDKMDPHLLGRKSLAINLSDIAAMGGTPHSLYLSVAIPPDIGLDFIERFRDGMAEIANEYKVDLLGGDTTSASRDLVINIAILGLATRGQYISRKGARTGDLIQVSGPLGNSAGGLYTRLNAVNDSIFEPLRISHDNPVPRIKIGQELLRSGKVTAMIDISDGIAQDLEHICRASNVGAMVNIDHIPVDPLLHKLAELDSISIYDWVLAGGEDYELCWTVDPTFEKIVLEIAKEAGASLPRTIGKIVEPPKVDFCLEGYVYDLKLRGWDHFKIDQN